MVSLKTSRLPILTYGKCVQALLKAWVSFNYTLLRECDNNDDDNKMIITNCSDSHVPIETLCRSGVSLKDLARVVSSDINKNNKSKLPTRLLTGLIWLTSCPS